MTEVDGGRTAKYFYDASSRTCTWGTQPLAVFQNGVFSYEHQDWLGTERLLTDGSGNTAGSYGSLPFGDNFSQSGADVDPYHFAGLDHDYESGLDHAQFREYSSAGGRWLSPDPYQGSYDSSNPQSLNRYSYVLNDPLSQTDPLGLDDGGGSSSIPGPGLGNILADILNALFYHPTFNGTLNPRPNSQPLDEGNFTYGPNIAGALGLPDATCEFGPCGGGGLSLNPSSSNFAGPILLRIPPQVFALSSFVHSFFKSDSADDPYQKRLFGTHYCGIGGAGNTINELDKACAAHDLCYGSHGFSAFSDYNASLYTTGQAGALQTCNQALCNAARGPASRDLGSSRVSAYFTAVPVGACSF